MRQILRCLVCALTLTAACGQRASRAGEPPPAPFGIRVLDRETRRAVPLVELTTVGGVTFVTDNAGWAAIAEPGWWGQKVWFDVKSHGYKVAKDAFGSAGAQVLVTPGGRVTLEIERLNVAERLYRITGDGRWRDSVLLGEPVPEKQPLLRGGVVGQDSTQALLYRGRIHWLWGDTTRLAYPLGQFQVSGATSLLPSSGGLEPDVGIDLSYWEGPDGFSRPMCPIGGGGPVWVDGLCVLADPDGRERLLGTFARMKDLGTALERGLVLFDDDKAVFEKLLDIPLDAPLYPRGHARRVRDQHGEWIVFGNPFPTVRVRADWASVQDLSAYEAFTCLPVGARSATDDVPPERSAAGRVRWAWKRGTAPLDAGEQRRLVDRGTLQAREAPYLLADVEGGAGVTPHAGSLSWNVYRRRWVAVFTQAGGRPSFLGEIFFAEADSPTGPWGYARRIVTHDRMTFYNPVQHPFFDSDGGRVLRFEGTYTTTFSNAPTRTPRYDYNQILYRLDLADPRLALPVAWYALTPATNGAALPWTAVVARGLERSVTSVAFFGPPDESKVPSEPAPSARRPALHDVLTLDRDARPPAGR